jgi:Ras-related GTP-binding protein C/D
VQDTPALRSCGSLVYVIDAHEPDKDTACNQLYEIIKQAHKINPGILFEVFIHKVDSDMFQHDEQKFEALREISENMRRLLSEYANTMGSMAQNNEVQIGYHLTSIYDHSIYLTLSKCMQKLLPQVVYI